MCGGNKLEEDSLSINSMDENGAKPCAKPARILLFVLNFIIWLGSCCLLALGIYGLVDSPFASDVLDSNSVMAASVMLIGIGAIGFLISFIGCCGAFLRNKCLILTYVIVLIILLAIMLIGGILGFMYTAKLQTASLEAMIRSIRQYDKNSPDKKTNIAWNAMQRSIKCCGIMSQNDWQKYNSGFSGSNVPESCCVIDEITQAVRNGCAAGTNTNNFYAEMGCHQKLINILYQKAPYVAIVGAVVAFCMILGVILGLVAYTRI